MSKKLLKKPINLILTVALIALAVFVVARLGLFGQKVSEVTSDITNKATGGGFVFTEDQKMRAKIPFSELRSGGPSKDGIPSIDSPKFIAAKEADEFLKADDPILGLDYKGITRAYPHRIMNWHEIVNDTVAGDPILITYCPLCFSGIAFERKIGGKETTFGVSGRLYNSNLVMYDRSTETLWTQLDGEAIIGEHLGKKLAQVPLFTTTWAYWKNMFPDTKVLSSDTGYSRDYSRDPYEDHEQSLDTFGTEFEDTRLHPKAKIWGIEIDGKFKAYNDEVLKRVSVLNDKFAGKIIKVTRSEGGEVKIADDAGNEFVPIISYWFAWVAFHPETELYK